MEFQQLVYILSIRYNVLCHSCMVVFGGDPASEFLHKSTFRPTFRPALRSISFITHGTNQWLCIV